MMKMPSPLSGIKSPFGRMRFSIISTLFANNEAGVWYDPSQAANLDWRRNLLTFTEQFDNAAWTKNGITVVANTAIDPVGIANADKLVENTSLTRHNILRTVAVSAGSSVFSIYVKAAERKRVLIREGAVTGAFASFDVSTGSVISFSGGTPSISEVGNGWYRCALQFSFGSASNSTTTVDTLLDDGAVFADTTYTGDGTSGIFIWGAQLELGSTATAYQRITDVNTEVMERFPEATLFQDTAGTTPVTTSGQTVGLMLDKSKGLVLGSERLVNGDFSSGSTGWSVDGQDATHIATFSSGTLRYQSDTTSPLLVVQQLGVLVIGRTYLVEVTTSSWTSGSVKSDNFGAAIVLSSGVGTTRFRVVASSTTFQITRNSANVDLTIDNISVKELAGNHATQATAASRPTYGIVPFGGRRNLLTFSEQFDNNWGKGGGAAITANAELAPDGTMTADNITSNAFGIIRQVVTVRSSVQYTFSFWAKNVNAAAATFRVRDEINAVDIVASTSYFSEINTDDFTRVYLTFTTPSTCTQVAVYVMSGDFLGTVSVWGAQLEAGSTATAYQRVTTQYDVTEAGVPPVAYLAFVDHSMVTPTITPNIDKVQVFAGVRKLSDAATGLLVETSTAIASNNGVINLQVPSAAPNFGLNSKGTIQVGTVGGGVTAPQTAVITGLGDIAGDSLILRANGTQVGVSVADQGTGNYLAYPLYIGRRGGTSLPFNGQLYSLIARFGSNLQANDIANTETYVASKTGVTL